LVEVVEVVEREGLGIGAPHDEIGWGLGVSIAICMA
jgi:hypothetical protein